MATDDYGQGIAIPALTDAPSISLTGASIHALVPQTIMRFASASARNAAIPSPVAGMQAWLTAEKLMTYYDGTSWTTYEPPQVQTLNSSFSLSSHATNYTALNLGSVVSANRSGMWAGGQPTRLVAPAAGTYAVGGVIIWPGTLGSADGRAEFRVNGSGTPSSSARFSVTRGSSGNAAATASGYLVFTAAGQYAEVYANQNSGSTLTGMSVAVGMHQLSTAVA